MNSKRETYLEGWKLYPWCMLGHHAQGILVGIALIVGSMKAVIISLVWIALYITYQSLSVLRKKDSPGLDISDFMMGFGIGIIGTLLILSIGIF